MIVQNLSLTEKQEKETLESKKIAKYGDDGQGEKLTDAKINYSKKNN